jgi:hypothetical protein
MKTSLVIVSFLFLGAIGFLHAQQFLTNNVSQAAAIRYASSRLWVGIREEEILNALDKPSGLKSGGRVGDSFGWTRFYFLSNGCFLDLEIEPRKVRTDGKWADGLLKSASISSNGVKLVSVTLTNAP